MKYLFTILIIASSLGFCNSQEVKLNGHTIDLRYGVKFFNYNFRNTVNSISNISSSTFIGLGYGKRLSERIFVKSGIGFFSSDIRSPESLSPIQILGNGNTGTAKKIEKTVYSYLEIPLNLRYVVVKKKLDVFIESGFNFRNVNRVTLHFENSPSEEVDESKYSSLISFVNVNVGLEKDFGKRFKCFIQASYEKAFYGDYFDKSANWFLDFGFESGIRIKI